MDAVASRDVGFEVQHGRSIMGVKPSDLQKSFGEVGSARAGYAPHRREGRPQTGTGTAVGDAKGEVDPYQGGKTSPSSVIRLIRLADTR